MNILYDHAPGDFTCQMCDMPPEECGNCGGIIHFKLEESISPFCGATMLEIAECDICGPDYIL